ncbi:MAG: hypothetical protein JXQ73_31900 [Phycisphaerae bacterium]|nr:hypothetical protein [Phycisphaerae bacterium]
MTEVFANEDQAFDRLFVLTDEAVYVSNPDKAALAGIGSRLREGAAVKTVVMDAERIGYVDILSVKTNKHNSDFNIAHRQGSKSEAKNVSFEDASARDAALAALERRLGPGFERAEVQYGVVRAALGPVVGLGVSGAATYLLVELAKGLARGEHVEIHGRGRAKKRVFLWLVDLLGPTGVTIVGGLVVLAFLAWLVARVKKPPLMITLTRAK